MKLYYSPGACSLAPHIVALELDLKLPLEKVDLRTKNYSGGDYTKVNSKGSVPAIELENGEVLTEVAVILQYLADHNHDSDLMPRAGSIERYRELEWLNFVSSEIHKRFSILFSAARMVADSTGQEQLKAGVREALGQKFTWLSERLGQEKYLMGETFTVADAYLFTVLRWSQPMGLDLQKWPVLAAYFERVGARPKVKEAMAAEGLKA